MISGTKALRNETKLTLKSTGNFTKLAFSGVQIVDPKIFQLMPQKKVFSLVDLYLSIASENRISYFDHSNSLFLDLGKKKIYRKQKKSFVQFKRKLK